LKITVPAVLIVSIGKESITNLLSLGTLFLELLFITLAVYTIGFLFSYFILKNKVAESAFFSMGSSMSNVGMVALPLLYQTFGEGGVRYVVLSLLVVCGIFVPLTLMLIEYSIQERKISVAKVFLKSALQTFKNPFVFGTVIGLILSIFKLQLPLLIEKPLFLLAASMTPVALFAVGLDIDLGKIKKEISIISLVSFFKLILMPLLMIVFSLVFNLSPESAIALLIISAAPTAKSLFALTQQYEIFTKEGTSIVIGTTTLSVVTITGFLFIGKYLWPTAFVQ